MDCKPSLHTLYEEIAARAPHARITVMLYPHLFTNDPTPGGCQLYPFGFKVASVSRANILWLNRATDALDARISKEVKIAKGAGVNISTVDPRTAWNGTANGASPGGHGVCTNQSWFYGLFPDRNPTHKVYSFHPNRVGQFNFEATSFPEG